MVRTDRIASSFAKKRPTVGDSLSAILITSSTGRSRADSHRQMRFYIDEAGLFILRAGRTRYSCVGCLVIPDAQLPRVEALTIAFKRGLFLDPQTELEGSRLHEDQVARLVDLLAPLDVMFEATVYDSHAQDEMALGAHKMQSALGMVAHVTPTHHPSLRAQLEELKGELERLPGQLYAQASLTTMLLHRVVPRALLYYVQRLPEELATFAFEHDPKDGSPCARRFGTYDKFFAAVIRPWLQSRSFDEPAPFLEDGDYSHFKPYETEPSDYMREMIARKTRDIEPRVFDLNKVFANFTFPRSESSFGLQLVDVLTNAVQRTLNRKLEPRATSNVPKLMVQQLKGRNVLNVAILGGTGADVILDDDYAADFIRYCDRKAKVMLPARRRVRTPLIPL